MKVGDVVVPRQGGCSRYEPGGTFVLHCGSGMYTHAIVASLKPFALVSEHGDMLWTATVEPDYFLPLCQASEEIMKRAVKRFEDSR